MVSSVCSSPRSHRSSRSSTGPLSPQTNITTPSSCSSSPKLDASDSFVFSPREEEEHNYTPLFEPAYPDPQMQAPQSPSLNFSPSPTPAPLSLTPELSVYDEAVNFYLYSPLSPTSISYYYSSYFPEYYPPVMTNYWAGYSGYPPASAFYGPLPSEISPSPSPSPSSSPISNLSCAQMEEWQAEDAGQLSSCAGEYSAMHMHYATM